MTFIVFFSKKKKDIYSALSTLYESLIGRNFGSIDRNGKKIILESLDDSIAIQFLFDQSKRALDRSKLEKIEFFAKFSSDYSESLRRFQAL